MAHRIEIASKVHDTRADVFKKKIKSSKVKDVFIVDVYTIDKELSKDQLKKATTVLSNSTFQTVGIDNNAVLPKRFSYMLEIGFLPGVTDNVGHTAQEIISDSLKTKFVKQEQIYTSRRFFLNGRLTAKIVEKIAETLYNPLIQRAQIMSAREFLKSKNIIVIPKVKLAGKQKVIEVDLNIPDQELEVIGMKGVKDPDGSRRGPLALPLVYMKAIQKHFKSLGRNPTDIELESLAQTWSEHCKHTIFADSIDEIKDGLFKTYIKGATDRIRKNKGEKDFCISVFTDNAGIIAFDEKYAVTHKVETHNSPSALDPFGGSVTGIVGVNRDAIGAGMGAKPVINYYGFCFAPPDDNRELFRDKAGTSPLLSARRIMEGVVNGVNYGGNCSGIPTPQGFLYFHPRYRGKPGVFVGTVGLIPRRVKGKPAHLKKAQAGDLIVMVGGRVGLDGIHGVTFASVALDLGSPQTAVQIGDPITQKKLSDAIVKEALNKGLYSSITDIGGGGLSCSCAEMAKESGGCEVDLDKVPLKYPGLSPWQTWISESQERMTLAVPKSKWKRLSDLFKSRGVEATVIGKFTSSGRCIVRYEGKKVMDMDMNFLHYGLPPRPMITRKALSVKRETVKSVKNLTKKLHEMLSDYNFASHEYISSQYDHEVQGGSVLKPLIGRGRVVSDTTVTRPVLSSQKGVLLSQSLYPDYTEVDAYKMAACAIDTAVRNIIAVGGSLENIALLDNFCWASSNEPERLYQLKEAVRACYDYAVAYGTPFISGKDTMFNDFKGFDKKGKPIKISVPPTLLISSIGVIDDTSKTVSSDLKFAGDLIYILGETFEETIPSVDAKRNKDLYRAVENSINQDLLSSSQSVHNGGLLMALARSSMAGMLGIDILIKNDPSSLLSPTQGRILVSVNPQNKSKFEETLQGNSFTLLGEVRADEKFLVVDKQGKKAINTTVDKMLKSYRSTFKSY